MKRLLLSLLFLTSSAEALYFDSAYTGSANADFYVFAQTSFNDFDGKYIPDSYKVLMDSWYKYDNFTAVLALDTENNTVEDAHLRYDFTEYSDSIYPTIKWGTSDAYYGFYNWTDDLSSSTMTVLPQGVYAYDFIKGGFSKTNGVHLGFHANNIADSLIFFEAQYSKGKPAVDDYDMYEMSMLGGSSGASTPNVDIEGQEVESWMVKGSYMDKFTLFYTDYEHEFKAVKQGNWLFPPDIYAYLMMLDDTWYIDIERLGVQFMLGNFEFTVEEYTLDVTSHGVPKTLTPPGSKGGYAAVQWYQDNYVVTAGLSSSKSDATNASASKDYFLGVVVPWPQDGHTIGIEYHKGEGSEWIIEGTERPDKWQSLVLSYSYKF